MTFRVGGLEKAFVFFPRNSDVLSNITLSSLKRARTDLFGTRDESCGGNMDF